MNSRGVPSGVSWLVLAGVLGWGVSFHASILPVSSVHAAESGHAGGYAGGAVKGGGHDSGTTHTDDHTDDHGTRGHGKKGQGGSGGRGGGHAGAGSQYLVDSVFRGAGRDGLEVWQGRSGRTGSKGAVYGSLYTILREADGSPLLDSFDRVQFVDADGNVIPYVSDDPAAEGFTEVADEAALQEVEFERLNLARAPSSVLDYALDEALRTLALDADGEVETDAAGRLVIVDSDGTEYTIDSPRENLSLFRAALTGADWTLQDAAAFLGSASSKTQEITVDTVVYLNTILGINVPQTGYYDLSGFAYDRSTVHSGSVTYLVDPEGDGTYVELTEPVMDAVFGGSGYSGSGADAFAQAADDARAVIEFTHEPVH